MKHEMQHPEGSTWCIHCGTFDLYCDGECYAKEPTGKYDSRQDENFKRMAESIGLTTKCRAKFDGPSTYYCELDSGHAGEHYATCHNPQFSQKWGRD